jgi:NAD(P)-dependent dehydrogenase (short-subunit alcohol dehydrogenase family)
MKKTIFLTGATDGIGKMVSERFSKQGHNLIIHGRNNDKLSALIEELKISTGNDNISGYISDFSNLDDVKNMAKQLINNVSHIDVLINNAGVYVTPVSNNNNGYDLRFVVNYFAQVLLTDLLLPIIKKSDSPRIINLSSAAQAPVDIEALQGKKSISARESYAQSKLAFTMWSMFYARKHENITTIPVNPGSLLNTKMAKEAFGQVWSEAKKGSDVLYNLAITEGYEEHSGKYFDNDKGQFSFAHPDAYDDAKYTVLEKATKEIIK